MNASMRAAGAISQASKQLRGLRPRHIPHPPQQLFAGPRLLCTPSIRQTPAYDRRVVAQSGIPHTQTSTVGLQLLAGKQFSVLLSAGSAPSQCPTNAHNSPVAPNAPCVYALSNYRPISIWSGASGAVNSNPRVQSSATPSSSPGWAMRHWHAIRIQVGCVGSSTVCRSWVSAYTIQHCSQVKHTHTRQQRQV